MDDIAATPHKGVHGHMDLVKARRHSVQHQRPLLNMTGCLTVHCLHCHVLSNLYDPLKAIWLCQVSLSCLC